MSPEKVAEINRLLAQGRTTREIAAAVGCCLESVCAVRARMRGNPSPPAGSAAPPAATTRRCPGCGYRITTARCLICEARTRTENEGRTEDGA